MDSRLGDTAMAPQHHKLDTTRLAVPPVPDLVFGPVSAPVSAADLDAMSRDSEVPDRNSGYHITAAGCVDVVSLLCIRRLHCTFMQVVFTV